MKRRVLLSFIILTFLLIFCFLSQAGEVILGDTKGNIYGELIICPFPNIIVLDGKLNELAWRHASWHFMEAKDASIPAPDNKSASIKFAAVADMKYIYIGADITDDKVLSNENIACDVWNDDSFEVYIDGGNEKAPAYDVNDAQITIGADFVGVNPDVKTAAALLGGCVGTTQGPKTETIATASLSPTGWILEVAIPLKNSGWDIKPKDGLKIGFNVQYNDDDNGTGRDYKLIWCSEEIKKGEGSWSNPSLFAEMKFVSAVLAVDSNQKSATTWALIKADATR